MTPTVKNNRIENTKLLKKEKKNSAFGFYSLPAPLFPYTCKPLGVFSYKEMEIQAVSLEESFAPVESTALLSSPINE